MKLELTEEEKNYLLNMIKLERVGLLMSKGNIEKDYKTPLPLKVVKWESGLKENLRINNSILSKLKKLNEKTNT